MPNLIEKPAKRALVICTVRYSDNLGDGVIGDCLAHMIALIDPSRDLRHFDMAGRRSYGPAKTRRRIPLKSIYYSTPTALRSILSVGAWFVFKRRALVKSWRINAPDSFDLVFGGGQILADTALNFPLKFALVARLARTNGARMAISAVGVGERWSAVGKKLFTQAILTPELTYCSVRDDSSYAYLTAALPALKNHCRTTSDPGVWAADAYSLCPTLAHDSNSSRRVGIGVAHPSELASHAASQQAFSWEKMTDFFVQTAMGISAAGMVPVFFTNGASEDDQYLTHIKKRCAVLSVPGPPVEYAARPTTPIELATAISQFDAVIAHRLHANIVAYALGIPSVALVWDSKVRSFCEVSRRTSWMAEPNATPETVVELVQSALATPVDIAHRDALKKRALDEVESMIRSIDTSHELIK